MAAMMVAGAWAQGTFTIRRPADGARVRETVNIRIPKNSIPEGGYLGIVVNGKFVEAVMPKVEGDDYVYGLDTKARGIPDGPATIEAILYMYSNNNPVVLNRSSVQVTVDNHTSIKVPEGGLDIKYMFKPGSEFKYDVTLKSTVSTVSQAQAQLGSRGREINLTNENVRMLWAVDNAYSTPTGTQGLVRIQLLPDKGKGYVWATPTGASQPELIFEDQMMSLFHRLTNKGREVFSSFPTYFPMDGTSGVGRSNTEWFLTYPFPILPARKLQVGDVFPTGINIGAVPDDGNLIGSDKFYKALPGRGVFEGVEWRDGIPCAKLSMTLQLGAKDLKDLKSINGLPGDAQNLKVQQLVWMALDRGVIVRQEVNFIQESLVEVQSAATSGATGGPGFGSRAGGPAGFGPGDSGSGAAVGGGSEDGRFSNPFGMFPPSTVNGAYKALQLAPPGQQGRRGPGAGGPQGQDGGGFGRGPAGVGGSTGGVKVIQRVALSLIFQLEN